MMELFCFSLSPLAPAECQEEMARALEYQSADGVEHSGGDTLSCTWEDLLCAVETERLFFLVFQNEERARV